MHYFCFATFVVFFFFAVLQLVYKKKDLVNYYLAAIFFATGYVFFYYWFFLTDYLRFLPWISYTDIGVTFTIGPFLYFYFLTITGLKRGRCPFFFFHLLPALLSTCFILLANVFNPAV